MRRTATKALPAGSLAAALALIAALAASAAPKGGPARPGAAKPQGAAPAAQVDFDRDVRPILAESCFTCHGFDANKRQAGLRLDTPEGAFAALPTGHHALVAGDLRQSTAIQRIADRTMPPSGSKKPLSDTQISTLKRWVAQGAKYRKHWALLPPAKPALPAVKQASWPRNPVDRFILARLEREGLRPSPEADRVTLIRRVTLDLTGLPPTPDEVAAFLADAAPGAYERVVDRLLASPRYGERMAWDWLDAARYADTNGYQGDRVRTMWPWRDWVIRAYNADMPYDQFTVEQLAGDLLPNPTVQQRIATGFHRNHMLNGEGGRIPEESRVDYVVDRVDTTATVWMGLTLGCARCHDHKYDPFAQKEYYQLFAFFNNLPESGAVDRGGNANPVLPLPTPEQTARIAELQVKIGELEGKVNALPPADSGRPALQKQLEEARNAQKAVQGSIIEAMVMEERPQPRDSFVLIKGAYDRFGEKVSAGVPSALPSLPPAAPANRLALARWLVDPRHPLTSRVAVNRLWQMLFGTGIVKTAEDFGVQGERPTHPELLDWLATEFTGGAHPWSVKALIRLLVTSAAYRQSSRVAPALAERDPENRLLARGPRFRLPSPAIRDQALSVAGLLVEKQGGPSVRGYQPPGVWEDATFGQIRYEQEHGEALYRRSLYTFWRRIVAPTEFFDTATRQACTVRQARTNTPLHALITLNDVTYVEAARAFAQRVLQRPGSPGDRLDYAFRLATSRPAKPAERTLLLQRLERLRAQYASDLPAASKLLAVGESKRDEKLDPAEHAAWTSLCLVLLNLDETLTKE